MKSLLRNIAYLSSLVAIAMTGQASAQMQGQQRASTFQAQPAGAAGQYRMPAAGYNPAATGYSYGQPSYKAGAAPRAQRPLRPQRPVARVAQAYGPAAEAYSGVPGYAPTTSPYAPAATGSSVPAYAPAAQGYAPAYTTIAPTNGGAVAATQMQQQMPMQQMPMQQMAPMQQTPMQQMAPTQHVAAPAVAMPPAVGMPPAVAPAQHAVIDGGAGCAPGGGYDAGFVGDGMMMGGMVGGGEMMYGGGDCGGEFVPSAPISVANVSAGPTWFGGFYGLIMNRDDENEIYFLTEPSVADGLHLSSRNASMEVSGGYEVRLGRIFNGGSWGMEFVYWELFPDEQISGVQTAQTNATQLYTTTDYRDVNLNFSGGARDSIANTFSENGAIVAARVRRNWAFQNIELNLLSGPLCGGGGLRAGGATPFGQGFAGNGGGCYGGGGGYGPSVGGCGDACGDACSPCGDLYANPCGTGGCGPRLQIGWLAGLRYFKFDESLGLDYDIANNVYDLDADTEFQHDIRVENDLVGVQLGLNLNYCLTSCFSLDGGMKFGLFGNHISHSQTIRNGNGFGYYDLGNGDVDFNANGDDEDIAFLGEFRFGGAYKIGCHWRLSGGYRAMALSGVGLATNQLPYARSYTDLGKVGDVDRNGHLILHGAYAGVEFCW